jgi:hypothetical protein
MLAGGLLETREFRFFFVSGISAIVLRTFLPGHFHADRIEVCIVASICRYIDMDVFGSSLG